jgi:hypothetical protein
MHASEVNKGLEDETYSQIAQFVFYFQPFMFFILELNAIVASGAIDFFILNMLAFPTTLPCQTTLHIH